MRRSLSVYGIVRSEDAAAAETRARRITPQIHAVAAGSLAALVGPGASPDQARAALMAHFEMLEHVAAEVDVLPVRHGVSAPDERAIRNEILDENRQRWSAELDRLSGRLELRIRASFDRDAILARIVEANPAIPPLRERAAVEPEGFASPARVRLGRLVMEGLEARRASVRRWLRARAADLTEEVRESRPAGEMGAATLSLLLPRVDVERVRLELEKLPGASPQPITLRIIGPLPPWSFVERRPRERLPAASG
jgi:Gas vesicle synthesis protein GvpL/GvpF